MKERLIIKNFGPIKEADLTFGRFNVLIGEQATGKSTVAKLLAICRDFLNIQNSELPIYTPFEDGILYRGLKEFVQDNSHILYECDDYILTANRVIWIETYPDAGDDDYTKITHSAFDSELKPKSERFRKLLEELKKIQPPATGKGWGLIGWHVPGSFLQNDVANVVVQSFSIPAERGLQSIFSLGKRSISNISDSLFNQLAELDGVAREFKSDTLIEPLDIVYKNDNGHGFIKKHSDEKFSSLYNAASGYQSTIPVVLVTKLYSEIIKEPKIFIIEEPELNLFPTAQYELMKFLVDKTMNYGNTTLIATHSPYILTALNDLILSAQTGKASPEQTNKVMDKKYWLDSDQVSAYRMLSDGTCRNILDEETGLIHAEEIDEVSNRINSIYDDLCEIKYAK